MQYQSFFRDSSFPKIDIDFNLHMEGTDLDIQIPDSNNKQKLHIRNIIFTFKNSIFNFMLSSVSIENLFSLNEMKAFFNQKFLDLKISYVSIKILDLIKILPKDAYQIFLNLSQPSLSNDNEMVSSSEDSNDICNNSNNGNNNIEADKLIDTPKVQFRFLIDDCDVGFSITQTKQIDFNIKDVKLLVDNDKLNVSALVNQIVFGDQIISQSISFHSRIIISKITEIMINVDECNFNIKQDLIDCFFNCNLPFEKISLQMPQDRGIKLSLNFKQMSVSNFFIMNNLAIKADADEFKMNISIKIDSVDSNFMKFESNDFAQMSIDTKHRIIDMEINLQEITLFFIPLLDFISSFPKVKLSNPNIKLNVIIKPLKCNFIFGEDLLNVVFDSPIDFKIETAISAVSIKLTDFLILLNSNEIMRMDSLSFSLNKDIVIQVPSIIVNVSVFEIYKIIMTISDLIESSIIPRVNPKITPHQMSVRSVSLNIPLIHISIHQMKSRRSISLTLDNTELYMKNNDYKCDLYGQSKIHFDASDGFRSFRLANPFDIKCGGEFSDAINECQIEVLDPINFEISTYVVNQILKNLAATEYEAEQPYSINNETGTDLLIIVNNDIYKLKSQENLPNVPNFDGSDIKVQIGEVINQIQIYSSFSKIAFPLFFDDHFILVWMDMKILQLRLLSPISLKNKTNIDLKIQFLNQKILLAKGDVYYLNYKIEKLDSIIVSIKKNQQNVQLNEKSVVYLDNKYILVERKRKIETLHTTIVFRTPYYFRNELISNMTISINDETVLLKPCEIVPMPFYPPNPEEISFNIHETNEIKGCHVSLKIKEMEEDKSLVQTFDSEGKPFILQFTISHERSNIISISPLLIFYNSMPIPLIFSLSSTEPIITEKIHKSKKEFFPLLNSQKIWEVDNPSMVSPIQNDTKKINIYVSTKYSSQWVLNSFQMSDFDIIEDITIPFNEDIVSLVHFHILSHISIRPNSFIFFISPKYVISNQSNYVFSLSLFDHESLEILPNSTLPVTLIRKSLLFSIAAIPEKKHNLIYSHKVNIEKINSQYLKLKELESPILLQSSTEKEIHFITIYSNKTLPYLFVNKTDKKVLFIQKDTADAAHVVRPNESLPFFIFDENMPTIIFCAIGNKINFELDVNEPSFPVKIESQEDEDLNLYYYVDLSRKEGSIVTLCKIINNEISIKNDQSSNSSLSFRKFIALASHFAESSINISISNLFFLKNDCLTVTVRFSHISCLLITTQFQELCRLTLKEVNINSSYYDFSTQTQLSVQLIKLDDQNKYAVYPSVFQILPTGNKPAILFTRNSFGSHKYGKIELDVRPINLRVDLSFISDFIGDIANYRTRRIDPNVEFKMDDVQIGEIIHLLMPKQTKYHINKIVIQPFHVHLSFQRITKRSKHPFLEKFQFNKLVNFIPSFDNIAISIENSHFFRNLSGTTDEIVFKISHEIKKLVLMKLSRKINILGGNKLVKRETRNGVIQSDDLNNSMSHRKGGFLNRTFSVLSIIESTFCYISSVMDLYTCSPPFFRTDETSIGALSWGLSSLLNSFGKGIKVLISEPLMRRQVNGKIDNCGCIVGVGVGITKCAAFCISGLCNFSASLFSGAKRLIFTENFIFIDSREIEPSIGMHCTDNEKLLWFTESDLYGLIEVYSQSVFISNGNIFIQNIQKVERNENEIIIYDSDMKKFISTFDNENQASCFYNIIQAQLLRKKLFDIPSGSSIDENV